jgi:endoglycosylceramidase
MLTREGMFIDDLGRQVILHGVNLVNKNAHSGYLGEVGAEDFARMRDWGFNCVRLGVIWDGLEPQPGVINQDYLAGVAKRVGWAKEHGLYVILDMHQDLYSVLFSDGAPAWATLTDGKEHIAPGGVWSDAYFTSPAVQTALDHFWLNSPAEDGLGLQDHFAAAWGTLAQSFAAEVAVIGFDLFNEPFPGSGAVESQYLMFVKGAELLASQAAEPGSSAGREEIGSNPIASLSPEELAQQWLDPSGRFEILHTLEDAALFAQVIDVTEPVYAAFEAGPLMRLYQRVAAAIRKVAPEKILFTGTSMGSNMGVRSGIGRLSGQDGLPDPQQAYAPHGYDLVVDTVNIANASASRVEFIFSRHAQTAKKLGLAMLVGEWGAFDRNITGTLRTAWDVSRQFERHLCGDTYWHYEPDLDQLPPFQAISRPYPERTPGRLVQYSYAVEKREFACEWIEDENANGPGRVFLPAWMQVRLEEIQIEPKLAEFSLAKGETGAWLTIPPLGRKALRRKLLVRGG